MELFDKIKKGIILLSLCFVCLGQIFAQNAAKIGETYYTTLNAAAAAVPTGTPTTIEILQTSTSTISVAVTLLARPSPSRVLPPIR